MKSLYFRSPSSQLFTYDLATDKVQEQSFEDVKEQIFDFLGIPVQEQALFYNGRLIHDISGLETLYSGSIIDVNLRLQGGKGGFGSLLRGQAVSKRKITNFDASRDLQGRRIRNVKLHQKLMEWARRKKQEDKAIKKEVDDYNKQQKDLQGVQRDIRLTQEFKDKVEKWDNEMSDSIRAGARKAKKAGNNKERRDIDFELDDFAEPQKKKIIVTETIQSEVIKGKENGTDPIGCKISQKLQAILQNNGTEAEAPAAEEKSQEVPVVAEKPEEKKEEPKQETNGFAPIELTEIKSLDDLVNLGNDHLKHELMRLGLKCGGSLKEKAQRLYDIKLKPELLFNPKYIAKK